MVNYCLFVWLVQVASCSWNKKLFASSSFHCWCPSVSCVSGTITVWLVMFLLFFVPDWFDYNYIKSCLVFLLFWRTIEFAKFILLFLVTVVISWFCWCRVFFVLIIFCILFCSPLVICSFLSRSSASASIFSVFMSFSTLTILYSSVAFMFCLLSWLSFFSSELLQNLVVVLLRYQSLFLSKILTDFC